jgi:hypothetical protein
MRGKQADVLALLGSPDARLRAIATGLAFYNPTLSPQQIGQFRSFGIRSSFALERQLSRRTEIEKAVSRASDSLQGFDARILWWAEIEADDTDGLAAWSRDLERQGVEKWAAADHRIDYDQR